MDHRIRSLASGCKFSSREMHPSHKFCRLCLCMSGGLVDLLEENCRDKSSMTKAVQDLLQIMVIKEEDLPWMVCHGCLGELLEFQDFKIRCIGNKMLCDHIIHSKTQPTSLLDAKTWGSEVIKEEDLPWMVCHGCLGELLEFQDFKIRCIGNKMLCDHIIHSKTQPTSLLDAKTWGSEMAEDLRAHSIEEAEASFKPIDEEERYSVKICGDEDITDDDIDYCWCVDCHQEFLNFKELKVHSEVCRGLGKWNHGKENGLTSVEEEREVPFEVNSSDPGLTCARCKRNFRTRERLERHINKYDFKCMPKSVKNTEIDVRRAEIIDGGGMSLDSNQQEKTCNSKIFTSADTEKVDDSKINHYGLEKGGVDTEHAGHKTKQCDIRHNQKRIALVVTGGEDRGSLSGRKYPPAKRIDVPFGGEIITSNLSSKKLRHEGIKSGIVTETNKLFRHKTPPVHKEISLRVEPTPANILTDEDLSLVGNIASIQDSISQFKSVTDDCSFGDIKATVVTETETYICDYCRNLYSNKSQLRSHMVKVHLSLNPQKCPICDKYFTNDEEFQIHFQIHPKDKKFFCTICEESFFSKKILRRHILGSHHSKVAFVCTACGNGFQSWVDLGVHQSVVHSLSDKKYKCPGCGKFFMNKEAFKRHFKRCVLKSVSFICDVCGKEMSTKRYLEIHSLIHLKLRKYPCPKCPKRYMQSSSRNLHVRRCHLKMRPYECGICSKTFSSKCILEVHYRTHSDERPYTCGICHRAYKSKPSLKSHLRLFHCIPDSEMDRSIVWTSNN